MFDVGIDSDTADAGAVVWVGDFISLLTIGWWWLALVLFDCSWCSNEFGWVCACSWTVVVDWKLFEVVTSDTWHGSRFIYHAQKKEERAKIVILHEDSFERMDIIYWIGWKTSQNSNSMKSFERVFKQKTHQSRKSEGDKSQTHKQTCNSDELFHEIGMVRLQPEVISCTEWMALVVLVWDAVLVTDVVVGVVWVNGNGDVPKSDDNRIFFRKDTEKNVWIEWVKKQQQNEVSQIPVKIAITIGVTRAWWWCRNDRFGCCWFWRRIIWRIKSINLNIGVAINVTLLLCGWWCRTTRTNVLTFYCNIIDRGNWRNLCSKWMAGEEKKAHTKNSHLKIR